MLAQAPRLWPGVALWEVLHTTSAARGASRRVKRKSGCVSRDDRYRGAAGRAALDGASARGEAIREAAQACNSPGRAEHEDAAEQNYEALK